MRRLAYKADDLVAQPPTKEELAQKEDAQTKVDQARTILEMLLQQHEGSVEIKTARSECHAAGLSSRSVERAVKELGWDVSYKTDEIGKRTYYGGPHTAPSGLGEVAE